MARLGGSPDSATCQFFINVKDNSFLDAPQPDGAAYAVFGKVTAGLEVVDAIVGSKTATKNGHGDVPVTPIVIDSVTAV
jgi:cyclophilin family peptidyl-prolyl cis-trans isomerase